jgi:SAM-dependent methyltransferase
MLGLKALIGKLTDRTLAAKEQWEFDWQRKEWVNLFRKAENQSKVLQYWVTYRHLTEIRDIIRIDESSRVLDVGCGISTVLHYLPGHRFGIDPLAERYKRLYRYPAGIDIRTAYGESIPFESESFDVVFCSNCIDHTSDAVQTIAEIQRVLRPTGHFVLTCEVFAEDLGKRNDGHPYSMTIEKLTKLIEDFRMLAHWDSPWIGLKNYVTGEGASDQREHIFVLAPRVD